MAKDTQAGYFRSLLTWRTVYSISQRLHDGNGNARSGKNNQENCAYSGIISISIEKLPLLSS